MVSHILIPKEGNGGLHTLIYKRIRDLREDKDLSQQQLANVLNITQRTYSRYENDERNIPIEVVCALADFHKTSVDYLLGRTDQKKPYPIPHKHEK